jgi:DNA-binding GntR family transcriptional regulator
VTENELLDALREARPTAPDDALTVKDICNLTGWHREKVQDAIGRLAMQNRIEVHKVSRPDIGGRPVTRSAYRILPKKGGKK